MNIPHTHPSRRPQVLLEPDWRLQYWTRVLDSSEDELRRVVDEVGCQAQRVCARLWELRQQQAAARRQPRPS